MTLLPGVLLPLGTHYTVGLTTLLRVKSIVKEKMPLGPALGRSEEGERGCRGEKE
jgi:hypothetical protein